MSLGLIVHLTPMDRITNTCNEGDLVVSPLPPPTFKQSNTIGTQNNRKEKHINVILAFNMIFALCIDIGKKWKHEYCVFCGFYWEALDRQDSYFQ